MRTTLNLDDDVAAELVEHARGRNASLSRSANELIRSGLVAQRHRGPRPPYDPPAFDTGAPRLDVTDVAGALAVLDGG